MATGKKMSRLESERSGVRVPIRNTDQMELKYLVIKIS